MYERKRQQVVETTFMPHNRVVGVYGSSRVVGVYGSPHTSNQNLAWETWLILGSDCSSASQ